jgi:UDP-3-O-[3-hydroxymyristoyl] glucosamine N-acyltransferase
MNENDFLIRNELKCFHSFCEEFFAKNIENKIVEKQNLNTDERIDADYEIENHEKINANERIDADYEIDENIDFHNLTTSSLPEPARGRKKEG